MASHVFWRRALEEPGYVAAVEPDGTAHTAGNLLARVNQLTHGLRELGLRPGDGLAVLVPNGIAALEVHLTTLQSGWYLTPVNWHFTAPEIAYIVGDTESKAFFVHERFAQAGAAAAMAVACGQLWVARRETRPSRAGDSRSSSAATRSSCAHRRAAHDPPTGAAPADWPAGANAQCPTAPRTCRSSTFPRDQQQKIRLDMRANSGYQPTVTCQTEQAFCRRSVPSGLRQPVGSSRSAQENWTDFWTAAIALGGSDIPASLSASFGRQSCHVCIPATGDCRGD